MRSKIAPMVFVLVVLLSLTPAAQTQVKITAEHNSVATATKAFNFKTVPPPATDDAAAKAKLLLVDGDLDPNGADLSALTDGVLPVDEDEPARNLFFNAGTGGGRLSMDLGSAIEIARVSTYSWHPNTRGPQVYKIWASDGMDPKFNSAPKGTIDPTTCGWKFIAVVDTRAKQGDDGGQHGVSLTDASGSLGKYRYLLFDFYVTETGDDFGNTFYSEVDVVAKK